MFLSSSHIKRTCETCNVSYARITPTSIVLYLFLVPIGFVPVNKLLRGFGENPWLHIALSILLLILTIAALSYLIDLVKEWLLPFPELCPDCGDLLSETNGFGHNLVPTTDEIVLVFLYLLIVLSVYWVFS